MRYISTVHKECKICKLYCENCVEEDRWFDDDIFEPGFHKCSKVCSPHWENNGVCEECGELCASCKDADTCETCKDPFR